MPTGSSGRNVTIDRERPERRLGLHANRGLIDVEPRERNRRHAGQIQDPRVVELVGIAFARAARRNSASLLPARPACAATRSVVFVVLELDDDRVAGLQPRSPSAALGLAVRALPFERVAAAQPRLPDRARPLPLRHCRRPAAAR